MIPDINNNRGSNRDRRPRNTASFKGRNRYFEITCQSIRIIERSWKVVDRKPLDKVRLVGGATPKGTDRRDSEGSGRNARVRSGARAFPR